MAWDREDVAFILVEAVVRDIAPSSSSLIQSSAEATVLEATPFK